MILTKRLLTALFPILILVNLELFVLYPKRVVLFGIIMFVLLVFSLARIVNIKEKFSNLLGFSATPIIFFLSVSLILLFIEGRIFQQVIVIGSVFAYAVFLEHLFRFFFQPKRYQPYALENISGALNLISVFLITTASFNFVILFGVTHWIVSLVVTAVVLLITIQTLWASKIPINKNWLSQLSLTLVIFQILFVSYYLPTSPLVIAILIAIAYYTLINIIRHNLIGTLDKDVLRRYFIIGLVVIVLAFLSARWT